MAPDRAMRHHRGVQQAGRFEREAPADAATVGQLRRAVVSVARGAGFGDTRCAEIALAVSEVITNVVVHAYVDLDPGDVRVLAEVRQDGLTVVVQDDGLGLPPRGDSPGVGVALPLIAQLSDRFEVEHGPGRRGTIVRLGFDFDEAEEPGLAQIPAPADGGRPPVLPALEAEAPEPQVD